MSSVTTNGLYNNYWRSATGTNNNNGSSANHSPVSNCSSTSSSASSNGSTSVHVSSSSNGTSNSSNNFNGHGHNTGPLLLSPVKPNRYQSPYYDQQQPIPQHQHHPSPLPRTIINSNSNSTKYMNNTRVAAGGSGTSSSSSGLYSSSYESSYNNNSSTNTTNPTSNLRKFNQSTNEINITVNNESSSNQRNNKFYGTTNLGGNYYDPGTTGRDKFSPSVSNSITSGSSTSSSGGGVSVMVGRSSSYNHINTIGRTHNGFNGQQQQQNSSVIVPSSLNQQRFNGSSNISVSTNNSQNSQHQHQQRRMMMMNNTSNSSSTMNTKSYSMTNSNGASSSLSNETSSTSTTTNTSTGSSNGTVAVSVVTRSQSQKHNETVHKFSSPNINNGNVVAGRNVAAGQLRQNIFVGSAENNCKNSGTNNSQAQQQQRPVQPQPQRYSSSSAAAGTRQQHQSVKSTTMSNNNNGNGHRNSCRSPDETDKKPAVGAVVVNSAKSTSAVSATGIKKGILRKDVKKKKMSVKFPKEVCEVIGYGGDTSDEESDEEPVADPLDSASVQEVLDKSSCTPHEKELNRQTQKNTNFNSIKTNLLGYTSIEIGPILGSMNGMSLTGPSKPLISIGTFDSRNDQPKKFGYNKNRCTNNDEREQTKQIVTATKKDSIVKVNGVSLNSKMNSTSTTSSSSSIIKANSSSSSNNQSNSKVSLSINSSAAFTGSNNVNSNSNSNSGKSKTISTEKSKSNFNTNGSNGNYNGVTISTNSTNTVNSTTNSTSSQVTVHNNNNCNVNAVTGSGSTISSSRNQENSTTSTSYLPIQRNNIPAAAQNTKNCNVNTTELPDTTEGNEPEAPPPPPPITPAPRTSFSKAGVNTNATLNNLFILNDGNIASRRSTFLNDIISVEANNNRNNENLDDTVQSDSLEPAPRIVKSELKLESPTSRTADVHFDDSLEDSGLDIKTVKDVRGRGFTSESDNEKSGSNSDSGTEPDFTDMNRKRTGSTSDDTTDSNNIINSNGLFISVEEEGSAQHNQLTASAKLSPDSVLSEMSTTESLLRDEESSQHGDYDEAVFVPNAPVSSGPIVPPLMKRLAPAPPTSPNQNHSNQQQQRQDDEDTLYINTNEEEIYDDVGTLRAHKKETQLDSTFEDLYDDCSTLGPPPPIPTSAAPGKVTTGSYDFTDANNRLSLDSDLNEKIPLKPDDGIEFIGIRKIDSELFLNKQSTSPPLSPNKKGRQGSTSPKPAKRRVNQFFSTIGKRAGAAFKSSPLDFSSSSPNNKSSLSHSPPLNSSSSFSPFSNFKRSLSQDEVSMTRTQEIYATLSPAMLKNKGLAPVLNKLSKLELQYNGKDKDEDKVSRKNKFSSSLKKFLKFGSKDSENKYDLEESLRSHSQKSQLSPNGSTSFSKHDFQDTRRGSTGNTLPQRHSSISHLEELSSGNPGKYYVGPALDIYGGGTGAKTTSASPPRVHSADQLDQKPDQQPTLHMSTSSSCLQRTQGSGSVTTSHTSSNNNNGYKPARPPPPVIRTNKVTPSFVAVFANSNNNDNNMYGNVNYGNSDQAPPPLPPPPVRRPSSSGSIVSGNGGGPMGNGLATVRGHPPNKPKRKASIYRANDSSDGGAYTANYLETTYNHITSLNFESLKLIASQIPATIKRGPGPQQKFKAQQLCWSQFYVTDVEPLTHGKGFCFYSAFWEDESCILLVQESLSVGIAPLEFDCVESIASFEDIVPTQVVTWKPSEYINTGAGVKVFVSVLPSCAVQSMTNYLNNQSVSPSRKYFALLQATDYWGRDDISDLIVFHQMPSESDSPISDYSCGSLASKSKHSNSSPNFGLVYVASTRLKSGSSLLSTTAEASRSTFEAGIKRLVFSHNSYHQLLSQNDENILYRRICSSTSMNSHEVEAQLKLFLQLKLFGAQGNDLDKILRYRSEKQVTQWMDKERAFCMKDAIERTLQRNAEPISPLRKSFVEFLMISDNCAKAVLDLIVDLNPDY